MYGVQDKSYLLFLNVVRDSHSLPGFLFVDKVLLTLIKCVTVLFTILSIYSKTILICIPHRKRIVIRLHSHECNRYMVTNGYKTQILLQFHNTVTIRLQSAIGIRLVY